MTVKQCSECGLVKALDEFYKDSNPRNKTGRQSRCKACAKAGAIAYAKANPEWKKAKDKKYAEAHPEKERERSKRRREVDPDGYRAWYAEYRRKWRAEHPKPTVRKLLTDEERKQRNIANAKKWAAANPERKKAIEAKWRANNPERLKVLSRKANKVYGQKHPEALRAAEAHRRTVKRRPLPWAERDKMRIVYAKAKEYGMEVDHVVPLRHPRVSGLHVWYNLQLLAQDENRRKKNVHWPDMP